MTDWITSAFEWLQQHKTLLSWLFVTSIVTFIATLIAVPWLIANIPSDYFLREHPKTDRATERHVVLRIVFLVGKNLLGVVLILAGIAMLVLPGQGLLTILIGIFLMDFPGKRSLELAILRRKPVYKAVNWIRRKAGREPLELPQNASVDSQ